MQVSINKTLSSECKRVHTKTTNTKRNGYRIIGRNDRKQNRKPNEEDDGTEKEILRNTKPTSQTDTHLGVINEHYRKRNYEKGRKEERIRKKNGDVLFDV